MQMTFRAALAMCVCLSVPTGAPGQYIQGVSGSASDTSVVSVSATAIEHVSPDRAIVFLQIQSIDQAAEIAALENGEARAQAMQALLDLGFEESEISVWGYGAGPASSGGYSPPPQGMTQFEAKSGLRVVVSPIERLDAVVTSALLAGASIATVELESDQLESAMTSAAEAAVRRARTQALAMANAAGGELGALISLTTTPDYNAMSQAEQRYMMYPGSPGSQGVMLFPTDGRVRVTVQATWVFAPR